MNNKVLIGMSGGVDSSAAAYILKEQGYEVTGATIRIWDDTADACIADAKAVCETIGIKHQVLDFRQQFHDTVIVDFKSEYAKGRTPNPCVMCNKHIKWQALYEAAAAQGIDRIATGHYARIEQLENGRFSVRKAAFDKKDQTYVLWGLSQEMLAHTLMPLGTFDKPQIREIAAGIGLNVADKPDSQDICFVPDGDYLSFLKNRCQMDLKPGPFVDAEGKVVGNHKGICAVTIGQRKGLNLAIGKPAYVTEIRPDTNEVVIGDNTDLFKKRLRAANVNFMSEKTPEIGKIYQAKIRYNHKPALCIIENCEDNNMTLLFDMPQRAITPGQSVVLYDGEYILAGGIIENAE